MDVDDSSLPISVDHARRVSQRLKGAHAPPTLAFVTAPELSTQAHLGGLKGWMGSVATACGDRFSARRPAAGTGV